MFPDIYALNASSNISISDSINNVFVHFFLEASVNIFPPNMALLLQGWIWQSMEMIGARQMMPDLSSLMGTIGRQTFEISLVLLLRACCVFLSHLGTQPHQSLCQALSLSLISLLQMGPTQSRGRRYIIFSISSFLLLFSACKTSRDDQAVIWKMSPWNMFLVSSFKFPTHTICE